MSNATLQLLRETVDAFTRLTPTADPYSTAEISAEYVAMKLGDPGLYLDLYCEAVIISKATMPAIPV